MSRGGENMLHDNMMEEGLLALRSKLKAWYGADMQINTGRPQSRIDHLSLGMLGPQDAPHLHAKGAETRHVQGITWTPSRPELCNEYVDNLFSNL